MNKRELAQENERLRERVHYYVNTREQRIAELEADIAAIRRKTIDELKKCLDGVLPEPYLLMALKAIRALDQKEPP
jgi:hypothetical protein